ncbi:hypothetical protein R84B8_00550 [Treponema sp. R8-4-B8]
MEVTKEYSSSHTISYNGEYWFIYQGTGEPVTFKTEGNVVDTYMEFFEGASTYNWSYMGNEDDNSGEGYNAKLTKETTSGTTYFIRITTRSGTSGGYTFVVE